MQEARASTELAVPLQRGLGELAEGWAAGGSGGRGRYRYRYRPVGFKELRVVLKPSAPPPFEKNQNCFLPSHLIFTFIRTLRGLVEGGRGGRECFRAPADSTPAKLPDLSTI